MSTAKKNKEKGKEKPVERVTPAPKMAAPKKQGRTVRLEDLSGRLQVFNLPHEVYCEGSGTCRCSERTFTEQVHAQGRVGIRKIVKRLPDSFTLLPRAKSEPLHESVKKCPDVYSAMRSRPTRVRVLDG